MVRVLVSNMIFGGQPGGRGTEKANAPRGSGRWFNLPFGGCVSTFGRRGRRNLIHDARRVVRADNAPDWQHHRECGSLSEHAFGENVPAQSVHELAGDAQPEAGAAELARPRLINLAEVFPD